MRTHVPKFHAWVNQAGKLEFAEAEQGHRRAYLQGLIGQNVEVVVRKARTERTIDQNAYLHAVPFSLLAEYWGEDMETTKLLCLGECFGWKDTRDGYRVPIKPSTSALDTTETSHLIEWLPPWAMHKFGVEIPLPEKAEAA